MFHLKLILTINLMLHAAAIVAFHITGRDAGLLTAIYWTMLTARLALEAIEGAKRK